MSYLIELDRAIDPRIDYVFKVLFATEGNTKFHNIVEMTHLLFTWKYIW